VLDFPDYPMAPGFALREMADDVLGHDDRAVHDDAEVDGSQGEQLAGMFRRSMKMNAKSRERGMVTATMRAARML
jgi:hypothetical protein